jgi:hypothetical protein
LIYSDTHLLSGMVDPPPAIKLDVVEQTTPSVGSHLILVNSDIRAE